MHDMDVYIKKDIREETKPVNHSLQTWESDGKLILHGFVLFWHLAKQRPVHSGVGSVKTVWSVVKGNAKALAMLQDQHSSATNTGAQSSHI